MEVAIRSAQKKTVAAKLKLESDEFGRVIGSYTFMRQDALDDYTLETFKIPVIVAGLRKWDLIESEYEHCLVEAGRRGLMPWSRLGDVDKEYRNPRFSDEFGTENSWALLNAFTWVVKRNPPARQMEQIDGFRSMLPTVAT